MCIRDRAVVVLDVKTGEVLAIANYPTYTLTEMKENSTALYEDPLNPTRDRALLEACLLYTSRCV